VQVELGLKSAAKVAPKQGNTWSESLSPSPAAEEPFAPASSQVTNKQKTAQKKAKSKMAKLSRKKNRKR
jgi:hypothetical protein